MVESRDLCLLPHLHLLGGRVPPEYCHNFWCGKTRMVLLFDCEQILKIIVFISTECMNVTDGQLDTVMA